MNYQKCKTPGIVLGLIRIIRFIQINGLSPDWSGYYK
jgi:hypothetical protein